MPDRTPAPRADGPAYDVYMGRWSRLVARQFVPWLEADVGLRWLDVGCGTGALSEAILTFAHPAELVGIDRSDAYLTGARTRITDPRARFEAGEATKLPPSRFDAVVSGLVLNFVNKAPAAVDAMVRAARPGGIVASYVWDYAGRMEMLRALWDAAVELDAAAGALDEGKRFPLCHPVRLADLWRSEGLQWVQSTPIDVHAVFDDFDDYWSPFLLGQGPSATYVMSLDGRTRSMLRDAVRLRLPIAPDGSIRLLARAWAVQGRRPTKP